MMEDNTHHIKTNNNNNDNGVFGVHGPSIKEDLEETRKQSQEQAAIRLKILLSEMTKEGII